MKKLYSLALALLASASAFAQVNETFVFCNAKGDVIPNGTTITVNNYEIDEWDEIPVFLSGLYVKNTSDADGFAGMKLDITKIDNGALSLCLPGNCNNYFETGAYVKDGAESIAAGSVFDTRTEWLPEEQGACSVKYTIRVMSLTRPFPPTYSEVADGPTVTVNYVFDENSKEITAGINTVSTAAAGTAYTLSGQKAAENFKGIVIVNGRKELRK